MCFFFLDDLLLTLLSSFQPPNGWHEVYTPTNSVMVGGHFMTYDSMHLADVSRRFDVVYPQALTDQHHYSVQTTLMGMLASIARRKNRGKPFCAYITNLFSFFLVYRRKSLTSLCRMALLPHLYLMRTAEAVKMKALMLYIKNNLPHRFTSEKLPQAKSANYVMEDVEFVGIRVADVLVDELGLDYKNMDDIFTPMPWTHPGEPIELSDHVIRKLNAILI